jgi:hypothetical protein
MVHRSQRKIARQALGLSWAVPQVVAHRIGRMGAAGSSPSARDRKEFALMGAEKVAAFYESWAAMGWAALQAQQRLWLGVMSAPWAAAAGTVPSPRALAHQTLRILGQGLGGGGGGGGGGVGGRAVGNAKRLARVKRLTKRPTKGR